MTTSREQKTLAWYDGRFEREYRDACSEYHRLCELFKDVCWYNFETKCRGWLHPWRSSDPFSDIELLGMCFKRKWCRGNLNEHGHFPVWYSGSVQDAPELPPAIILLEIKAARDYMHACKQQTTAAHDWAPGGVLYNELLRTTAVGKPTKACVYAPTNKRPKFSSC